MNISELQELGLTEQESKIYLSLCYLGKASASAIATEAEVSYGTIYEILAQMERKGLVNTIPEKTKKFIATNPNQLINLVKTKEEKLNAIKQNIKSLKQKYELKDFQPIIIAQGKSNFHKIKSEMTSHKKRDYSIRPLFTDDPVTFRKMKERIKKGMDYKILFGPNASKKSISEYKKENISLKKIPIDNIIISLHDNETLITLLKKNTTILIKDEDFANLIAWLIDSQFN